MNKPELLLVGFVRSAKIYLKENDLNPNSTRIITSLDHLRGYKDIPCHFVHGWTGLPDSSEIYEYAKYYNLYEPNATSVMDKEEK